MSAHSAAPWKWFTYPDGRMLLAGHDNAVIHCPDAPTTVSPEDQALIAAAPDLLASCKELRDGLAGALRVIGRAGLNDLFLAEMAMLGIHDGIGVRSAAAIAKAEATHGD